MITLSFKKKIISTIYLVMMLLIPSAKAQNESFTAKIDMLLSQMTVEEKAGQLSLFTNDLDAEGSMIQHQYIDLLKKGLVGGIFNAHGADYTRKLQEIAVNESRLGIPLLFAFDVIHGHHTIFPIPLAEAASWDLEAIEHSSRVAATEASATGLHWVFAPMCDIGRDPRWGRVMEGAGEDHFLGAAIAAARVQGLQGDGFGKADAVAACVKHFAAYGAPQAGREYHTVDMSELSLREAYLPPYRAAVQAGALTVMTAFNELNGIPSTANSFLINDILRTEWGFDGFVVSDYTSILELENHGFAHDTLHATQLAFEAGTDLDMQSFYYLRAIPKLVKVGKINLSALDKSVKRILELKFKLGLFDDPYKFCSTERELQTLMKESFLDDSREMAKKSMVLLKNENQLLPLNNKLKKIAVIGPLAISPSDMLGGWSAAGDEKKAESLLEGLQSTLPQTEFVYAQGCAVNEAKTDGFSQAIRLAQEADAVILALGEPAWMTGEAKSRTDLNLPGVQQLLANEIFKANKAVVVVLFNGRPLTIQQLHRDAPAIVEAWFPGTKGGSAIAQVLFGTYNPSGKLPMTFPRSVGQIPIHYNMKNTGRPWDGFSGTTSRYIDEENTPLYPFGYGLSYTQFSYDEVVLDKFSFMEDDTLQATVNVTNTGKYAGEEVVQLYIHDKVASVTRPVKELKGFQKIFLQPGESKQVRFKIDSNLLAFYNSRLEWSAEAGEFDLMIGTNSEEGKSVSFSLQSKPNE